MRPTEPTILFLPLSMDMIDLGLALSLSPAFNMRYLGQPEAHCAFGMIKSHVN